MESGSVHIESLGEIIHIDRGQLCPGEYRLWPCDKAGWRQTVDCFSAQGFGST
jgi:hypothetical protein